MKLTALRLSKSLIRCLALGMLLVFAAGGTFAWIASVIWPVGWHFAAIEHHPSWILRHSSVREYYVLEPNSTMDPIVPLRTSTTGFSRDRDHSLSGYWRAWSIESRSGFLALAHDDAMFAEDVRMSVRPGYGVIANTVKYDPNAYALVRPVDLEASKLYERGLKLFGVRLSRAEWHPASSGDPQAVLSSSYYKVPYWLFVVVGFFPGIVPLCRHLRAVVRSRMGFCRKCGYDLRETPTICPECGMPIGGATKLLPSRDKRGRSVARAE